MSLPTVYWINLERDISRRERTTKLLSDAGLDHYRFSAIDGSKNQSLVRLPLDHRRKDGEIGCLLSHLELIRFCYYETSHEMVLIAEDDISFEMVRRYSNVTVNDKLIDMIRTVPVDWEIIQLSWIVDKIAKITGSSDFIDWIPCIYSTAGYLINRAGMEKICQYWNGGQWVLDNDKGPLVADSFIYRHARTYVYRPPIVTYYIEGESGIGNNLKLHYKSKRIARTIARETF